MLDDLRTARKTFLAELKNKILWVKPLASLKESIRNGVVTSLLGAVSVADIDNATSIRIAWDWASRLPGEFAAVKPEKDSGKLFQFAVMDFLKAGFDLGRSLRPGDWHWKTECPISRFDQYAHLDDIKNALHEKRELRTIFPEQYMVVPDIVVFRSPLTETSFGQSQTAEKAPMSPLVKGASSGKGLPILHASISCKITMRSDRAQNTRTEALNLLRNRKGRAPAIVAVTAEPLPTRLASLALGTGDVDFVYHAALPELIGAVAASGNQDQADMLTTLVEGRRLRDIADLALDLLI